MQNFGKILLTIFFISSFALLSFRNSGHSPKLSGDPIEKQGISLDAITWADSIYAQMNWEERIGQLFMARAHSDLTEKHVDEVKRIIKDHHVGGLCFFQGTPQKQAALTNDYQAIAKVPLMIAVDAEWGLGMRFKESAISYPRQLTLGAIQDNSLIYRMGRDIGRQLKAVGMHVNFAPVVDVNNNKNNPVINDRSFGEDRFNVTAKSYQYMRGMQDENIMACAKHFPGHGDTDTDSHLDLPVIKHNRQRLDSIELYPFKILSDKGIQSIMIAHLQVPAIDTAKNTPTTLSAKTVNGLLRNELGFQGLTFTDALEMKGVTKHFGPGEVALRAFEAGNDILVLPDDLGAAYARMKKAIDDGEISESLMAEKVKKILIAKYNLGLNNYKKIDLSTVVKNTHLPASFALKQLLFEHALTVAANKQKLIPIVNISTQKFASIALGSNPMTFFQQRLEDYLDCDFESVSYDRFAEKKEAINKIARAAEVVIISIEGMNKYANKNFGLRNEAINWINEISLEKKVILVSFGSPYALEKFPNVQNVLQAYEDDPVMQDAAAQGLLGVFRMDGKLPITASSKFGYGIGEQTSSLKRLGYSSPESLNLSSDTLNKIDILAKEMIAKKAVPGCQILVAKSGRIIYEKSFGTHTYSGNDPVLLSDLYDLASVTKIAATTLAMMRLQSEGRIDIEKSIGQYLSTLKGTNKADIPINKIMAHHAGLKSWIPFYKETMVGTKKYPKISSEIYHSSKDKWYNVEVMPGMFMKNEYVDTLFQKVIDSEVRGGNYYRYSDLGFILLAELIKEQANMPLDEYVNSIFYSPLGLTHTLFNPCTKFSPDEIIPTEEDHYFRMQRVQGYVHDMGCAMLGGVSGHAGLFSNAHDLAIIMQMLMNKGYYGGFRFIDEEIVDKFTSRYQASTRRGIGFDMKEINQDKKSYTSTLASDQTYGHTGFTGIGAWNDPANELTYIFLSNRTYPSSRTNKLNKEEYREKIHSLIYQSFLPTEKNLIFP